ncbi:MAG: type I-U CRISPR-associated protein Csb2 [Solirubrobacteraceae bacterium]
MPAALVVRVSFPRAVYSGGELGTAEELPSPARVHAAFVSAAAGGPWGSVDGRVLVAGGHHERALRWLEENEPFGMIAPACRPTEYRARRYRLRAAINHPDETDFEPFSALDGPVSYAWPQADPEVLAALQTLALEITHVGRADSIAIVDVTADDVDPASAGFLAAAAGRGPGRALRVATAGRSAALAEAHRRASAPGPQTAGSTGKQAADVPTENIGDSRTVLRRFALARLAGSWPFAEIWRVPVDGGVPSWAMRTDRRVGVAVAVHRALVSAIGDDVPAFVTGRDGDQPLKGAGHLAVHVTAIMSGARPEVVLAIPCGVPEADRAALLSALAGGPTVRIGGRMKQLGLPTLEPALSFWPTSGDVMATEVPMVLDAPGTPRQGRWTLENAVLCSVGYALRGALEADGVQWGVGWEFRHALVAKLRERGVQARAQRVTGSASRFTHRAREGDLLVAVDATVRLGDLAYGGYGFLALGRARHLGGGLLRPVSSNPT